MSSSGKKNTLTEPGKTCCAISKIQSSIGRRECVDGLTRRVQNGREISCVYVVDGGGMTLCVRRAKGMEVGGIEVKNREDDEDGTEKQIHLLNKDRLVVYHGARASNEIVAAEGEIGTEQCGWFVTMYCQSSS